MVDAQTFEQFLATEGSNIASLNVVSAVLLSALLALILQILYIRYGSAMSNRRRFSSNFLLLATTTTLVIMIVKSSLALALGLVGALSIVRFRAAIKEPEELSFLFISIAIGLGFGAGQWKVTIIAFVVMGVLILLRHLLFKGDDNQNLYLNVASQDKNVNLQKILGILKNSCKAVRLKRFDKSNEGFEASFIVDFASLKELEDVKLNLGNLSKDMKITYLDSKGSY